MRKLLSILLLLACSAVAKDYRQVTIHRHDKAIVMVFLPEWSLGGGPPILRLCVGTQEEMDSRGIDCYPVVPLPEPKELVSPKTGPTIIRVSVPESMFY